MGRKIDTRKISQIGEFDIDYFNDECNKLLDDFCPKIHLKNTDVLKKIKKGEESEDIFSEEVKILMTNYAVIRLVSLVENFLKGLVSDLIDSLDLNPQNILIEDSLEIKLEVLQNFPASSLTKGKLVVAQFDYINANKFSLILSRINRMEMFEFFDEFIDEDKGHTNGIFSSIYKIRNDIVHNLIDYTEEREVEEFIEIILESIPLLYVLTKMNIAFYDKNYTTKQMTDEFSNQFPKDIQKDFSRFLDKFKKISSKKRKEYMPRKPYVR